MPRVIRYRVPSELRKTIEDLSGGSNAVLGETYETWDGKEAFLLEFSEEDERLVSTFMFLNHLEPIG
ncbi:MULTISPECIES: hypothetical protein [Sinorhizobium]|uniref:hypothetical protein n=1 Tax=Sinorhizobium TaxID=28105 RepID=UPI000BEA8F97|nr:MULTISPECIES: hypothetical protein [Sinorhizobium]PDT55046.1 hypothetical protein CO664_08220 [Sinorhizobium sp. NG07B]POH32087.1 hypothetical protein ATY30_11850 [Sinorhizobium americanum]